MLQGTDRCGGLAACLVTVLFGILIRLSVGLHSYSGVSSDVERPLPIVCDLQTCPAPADLPIYRITKYNFKQVSPSQAFPRDVSFHELYMALPILVK